MICGDIWEGGEVACSGVVHVGIVRWLSVDDGADLSKLDVKFLRDRGMPPFVPAQKNYLGVKHRVNMDSDFLLEHLVALKPRPVW